MSADFYLHDDRGHEEGSWNVTYNLSPMLRAAVPTWSWHDLEGMDGPTGAAYLNAALVALEADPARFEAMNPSNGWGTYEGLVKTLRAAVKAVPEWPCKWSTWL